MAGMTALLLRRTSDGTSSNTEQYLEQAASVPASGVAQLDSLRAVALYYELYQEQEDWPSASDSLAKFASDVSARQYVPHVCQRRDAFESTSLSDEH